MFWKNSDEAKQTNKQTQKTNTKTKQKQKYLCLKACEEFQTSCGNGSWFLVKSWPLIHSQ